MSLNIIHLIGRIGKDSELKTTTSGKEYIKFTLATSEKWTDKNGKSQEKTTWHNCVKWGKVAKLNQHLKKGILIYAQGSQSHDQYEKDGEKKYYSFVNIRIIDFLESKKQNHNTQQPQQNNKPEPPQVNTSDQEGADDLPF